MGRLLTKYAGAVPATQPAMNDAPKMNLLGEGVTEGATIEIPTESGTAEYTYTGPVETNGHEVRATFTNEKSAVTFPLFRLERLILSEKVTLYSASGVKFDPENGEAPRLPPAHMKAGEKAEAVMETIRAKRQEGVTAATKVETPSGMPHKETVEPLLETEEQTEEQPEMETENAPLITEERSV